MDWIGLEFERPIWALVLIPIIVLVYYFVKQTRSKTNWQKVCDSHLLQYLVIKKSNSRLYLPILGLGILLFLSVIALMGPVSSSQKIRIYNDSNSRVFLLDLSASMNSNDIPPSRMERARFKILDMLKLIKTGQTAMVAFAGDAFVVTPLTEDVNTIKLHISNLAPEIMPVQGSRTDLALKKSLQLIEQAGSRGVNIYLITDGLHEDSFSVAEKIRAQGHRLSVLAVGTEDGAPVPLKNGGFLKDSSGAIVIPAVDHKQLLELARVGGGQYSSMTTDDKDINLLMENTQSDMTNAQLSDQYAEKKRPIGPWIAALMLPVFALGFRKGLLNIMILTCVLNIPDAHALEINQLLKNSNQRAKELYDKGDYAKSSELFSDAQWKGAAYYRAGKWKEALQEFQKLDSAAAYYNQGNVLAKMGKLKEAITMYDEAIKKDGSHQNAKFNKNLIEEMLKQQKGEQSGEGDKSSDGGQNQEQQNGEQESKNSKEQQQDQTDHDSSDQNGQVNEPAGDNQQANPSDGQTEQASKSTSSSDELKSQEQKIKEIQDQMRQKAEKTGKENGEPEPESLASSEKFGQLGEEVQEKKQSIEQWLRKVPDDPGGLLRRKFSREYFRNQEKNNPSETKNW